MTAIFHMTVCGLLWVAINQSILHHLVEGDLSENVKHFGGRSGWLADKKCWERFYWRVRGLLSEKKGKEIHETLSFYSQPHLCEHMHTHVYTMKHTQRPTEVSAVTTNRAVVTRGVGRRLWNQLSLCKNRVLLFVQSGHSQTRLPGWKHVQRAVNFQITSPPSVESFSVLTANSTIWPKLMCYTHTVVIRGQLFYTMQMASAAQSRERSCKRQKSILFKHLFNWALNKEQILVYRNGLSK